MNLFRSMCTWIFLGALFTCSGPSPWMDHLFPRHSHLTRDHMDKLAAMDGPFEPFSVGLIADPQVNPGDLKAATDKLNSRGDLSFHLILGDLTDRSLRTEFFWVADIIRLSRLPVLTVVGNHDGLLYGDFLYRDIFGDLNYSFSFRGIKFIMWNNNPYEWGYPDFDFLKREIEGNQKVIIASHQPPGSIERYPEANDALTQLYAHPNVLGSVHGHVHEYQYQTFHKKPAVTIKRVKGTHYGVMHVTRENTLLFEACHGSSCSAYP